MINRCAAACLALVVAHGVAAMGQQASPASAATLVASGTFEQNGVRLVFRNDDAGFSQAEEWRVVGTFFTIYPELVAEFNKEAPKQVTISVEGRYKGVAATHKDIIHVSAGWLERNPEDIDVITHESTHVVQAYPHYDPVWLVEGIADYARAKFGVNNQKAGWRMPDYAPGQNFDNSYRITARFLTWVEMHVKAGTVQRLDVALRSGTYTPDTWRQITGSPVEQLWLRYTANPAL